MPYPITYGRPLGAYSWLLLVPVLVISGLSGCDSGPNHVAGSPITWTSIRAFAGGDVAALAVSGRGFVMAGLNWGGGLYVSLNNGQSWGLTNLTNRWIVAIESLSDGSVVALGMSGWADSSSAHRSVDGGLTWSQIARVPKSLCVIDNAQGYYVVGTHGLGVFISSNRGDSWTQTTQGLTDNIGGVKNLYVSDLLRSIDGNLFAATWGGIVKSTDNGISWHRIALTERHVSALHQTPSGCIVATTDAGIYLSTVVDSVWNLVESAYQVNRLVAVNSGRIFALGDQALIYSDDNGQGWQTLSHSSSSRKAIVALPSGPILFSAENTIWRSDDLGASWNESIAGLTSTGVSTLCAAGNGIVLTSNGTAYKLNSRGTSAVTLSLPIHPSRFVRHTFDTVFAVGSDIYRSTDAGLTWGTLPLTGVQGNVLSLATAARGKLYVGMDNGRVYSSSNAGTNWTLISPDEFIGSVYALACNDNGHLLASDLRGGIRYSTDDGATWYTSSVGSSTRSAAVTPNSDFFAGDLDGGVFRSTDAGQTWTHHVLDGIYGHNVAMITFDPHNHLFAATYVGGVFLSVDRGTTWKAINDGLTTTNAITLDFDSEGFAYVGTAYGGLFRSLEPVP